VGEYKEKGLKKNLCRLSLAKVRGNAG